MALPAVGSKEFDSFMKRAHDPQSVEARILRGEAEAGAQAMQQQFRDMLQQMIELVPGQLFRDIEAFHEKFDLSPVENGHELPQSLAEFRLKFLMEELSEYAQASGYWIRITEQDNKPKFTLYREPDQEFNAEKAFDGLIDLVYVALGTAFLHKFNFNVGWARVHMANMDKVRAVDASDERSVRKHSADIVKPEGWVAPVLTDLLQPRKIVVDDEPSIIS